MELRNLLTCLSALALAALPASAAPAKPPGQTNEPEIQPDKHVTFRLKAPQASEVSVSGQSVPKTVMTKDEGGVWSATVGPVPPGVWEYSFTVDGVQTIDPGNPAIKPQRAPHTSILQISGDSPALWDFRADVPHGTMHWHDYYAKTLGAQRRLHVYTPPGYEQDAASKYPVLYLVHGFGDNDAGWSEHGKANWILDNLIAEGKAKPMIIVMPDGHPIAPETRGREEYGMANQTAFEHELIEDIIPMIETDYHVQADTAHRALAGLSMGGGHTLHTGLRHLDKFAWLGAFSAGIPGKDSNNDALTNPAAINSALKVFWIACGKSDFLFERNLQLDQLLTEKGIHHTWVASEGDHSWPVWRNYLTQFAPLLF